MAGVDEADDDVDAVTDKGEAGRSAIDAMDDTMARAESGSSDDVRPLVDTRADESSIPSTSDDDTMLAALAAAPARNVDRVLSLASGTVVADTFRIEGVLGRGAMGVVYRAIDLALDRVIALKLHASSDDDVSTSRMWREAKAMARLAHPNVLTVHEVGLYDGRVYIAMELVEGGSVRDWLDHPRSWREVLDVFVQAAEGLAAAHRVGLVHRDFKPSNMLRDPAGRVRVADFGLARVDETDDVGDRTDATQDVDVSKTRTGVVLGTPAYMAPEQFGGEAVDHRCDQFAFCVALHEGLYGVRPFEGETLMELHAAAAEGRVRAPMPGRAVPGWLREVVLRGLQPRPDDRFVDMDALLVALRADPTRRRRVIVAGVGVGVLALAVVGVLELGRARGRSKCWREAASLQAGESPHVTALRDAYAQSCIEAEVDGSRSVDGWAATRQCLEDRRDELAAMHPVGADPAQAGSGLATCTDDAWLAQHPARDRSATETQRANYWHARALVAAGRHDDARPLVDQLLPQIQDAELRAAALLLAATIAAAEQRHTDAATSSGEAFDLALAHGDDDRALEAAATLVLALTHADDLPHAAFWADIATTMLPRAHDQLVAAHVHEAIATLRRAQQH